ncbi:lysine-specific demethylase lid isoform X5 [Nilaparvata lugens]|uniref:lysine-specific demethylase lid isoform X5 n=1 Tax=Nilaparvata lugens TaxID=108931 RepID=UPI00193CD0DF|nr:lysine-specific demethylase lid isoform X5 [Nilaparvata lugens]
MEKGDSRAFFARTCVEYCLKAQNQVPDLNPPENPSSFIKPIEAPTFHPTKDEFSDPIAYINSVRPLAEQFGICKVVPPPGVTFPLSLPVDTYNFSTRLQHLNRIDAVAKSRSIFLGRLSKFYQLRGFALETPTLEFRKVDLYSLHHAVEKEGGYNEVCKKYKWEEVAKELDYKHFETIALALLEVYYTIIHPYVMVVKASDAFHSLIVEGMTQEPKAEIHAVNMSSYDKERIKCVDLQILEASIKLGEERRNVEELHNVEELPAQEQECEACKQQINQILLDCAYCKKSFHIKCIIPEMYQVPKGKWHCTPCIAMELKHTPDTFKQAFDHCEKQYHINEFQEMAETAKKKFFPLMNGEYPTSEMVEQRFWEIVGSENTMVDTVVEYGADLTSEHGTGFPSHASARTEAKPKKRAVYERFVEHPWNLNNIAACATSALKYIDEPISGMQIPWMYIGMIFSTFCWHNEDHWCYSINHLHLGDVKTWYSVPGQYAEKFEETVKELAPELFEAQPDTLQLLDTLVNPNALMKKGVPVYRMDQKAGEFMITFPRAYHCGFNQGFNLAEAVNFAPADWIKMGRRCVEEYSLLKRNNVFSHDELMFKIAEHAADADVRIAAAAYHDLYYAVKSELKLRQFVVSQWGAEELGMRFRFERFPDDDRQCVHCKTTVYLSAVICKCSADVQRMVCIKHYDKLCTKCKPQEHCLILKHTAEQMHELFKNLLDVVDPYEKWVKRMRFLFRQNAQLGDCIKQGMKSLLKEAKQKSYMSQQFFHNIKEVIKFVLFAPTCCLTVYGKAIITSDSEAFMYLVHFVEHILDVGHYSLCSNTVFKICKCLTDFKYAHYDESINEPDHQSESSSSSECESDSRSESASSSYSVSDRQKASCSYSVSDRQKASCSYSVSDRQKASCSYSVSDRQKASCSYSVSDRQKASCSYSVSDRQKASCSYSVSDRQTPSCSYSVSDRQKASCSYSASARKSAPRNVESDSEYEYHSESDSDSD